MVSTDNWSSAVSVIGSAAFVTLMGVSSSVGAPGTPPCSGGAGVAGRGHARARLRRGECGTRAGDRIGIGQSFDPHGDFTVGFCQPPGGETLTSTSLGPQVPGSYS